ncbi:MAG: hypothetical protein ACRDPR_09090 [Nocardioidaceae bacterium]
MVGGPWRPPPDSRTIHTISTGSSGATVSILEQTDGELLAVKAARGPRVSAIDQQAARAAIAPYFGEGRLPRVLFAGEQDAEDLLVTECPAVRTLADVAMSDGPVQPVLGVWTDVVNTLAAVWSRSARPGFDPDLATRNHGLRWGRAVKALQWVFEELGLADAPWRHLVVNDVDHGPLDEILDRLAGIPLPAVHVACQGDPQPRNVLVDEDGEWHLIDWEWAGLHQDWRMMTSHLVGWWYVEDVLATARGSINPAASAVFMSYQPPLTAELEPWLRPVVGAFRGLTTPDRHDQDLTALTMHIAMLLIREIPKVMEDGRPHLLAPLLGEAIRFIDAGWMPGAPTLIDSFAADRTTA